MLQVRSAGGFTIGELLIVIVIVGVLAAMATVLLQQARMSGNETSAIASMRTIVSGQASYAASNNGYAGSLNALAALCPGMRAGFISPEIDRNGVVKTGYILQVVPGLSSGQSLDDCNGTPTHTKFYATAAPETVGGTGKRAFAASTTSAIWQNTAGIPPTEPIRVTSTISVIGR